jgi:WbqC-like protein family
MNKKVAVVQSNYIPWKGYFDLINLVDEFILFDDMQYTRRDWRNRNKIKTPNGVDWLTIPVDVKGKYCQKINETLVSDSCWRQHHWKAIAQNYSRSRYFKNYRDLFQELYLGSEERSLSQINYRFLEAICQILGITTKLSWSMDYCLVEGKNERLIELCKQCGTSTYISGPSARGYIDEGKFENEGIIVEYMDYSEYPEYPQLYPPFEHFVSVIDVIFNLGHRSREAMLRSTSLGTRDIGLDDTSLETGTD